MILPYWTPTVLMFYIWTVKYWIITVIKKSVLKSYKTKLYSTEILQLLKHDST